LKEGKEIKRVKKWPQRLKDTKKKIREEREEGE